MKRTMISAALAGSVLLAAACGSGSNSQSSATSQPTAAPPRAPLAAATSTPLAPVATPATNPAERVMGTVSSIAGGKISLKEGGGFTLGPDTRITRLVPATPADLQSGKIVAVTAKRQADNTLLASLVRILPSAPGSTFFGQSTLPGGDLMTNATVDKVTGNGFTVTFPGGGAQVALAPGAQILSLATGSQADIKEGASITGTVRDGVAQTITLQ